MRKAKWKRAPRRRGMLRMNETQRLCIIEMIIKDVDRQNSQPGGV